MRGWACICSNTRKIPEWFLIRRGARSRLIGSGPRSRLLSLQAHRGEGGDGLDVDGEEAELLVSVSDWWQHPSPTAPEPRCEALQAADRCGFLLLPRVECAVQFALTAPSHVQPGMSTWFLFVHACLQEELEDWSNQQTMCLVGHSGTARHTKLSLVTAIIVFALPLACCWPLVLLGSRVGTAARQFCTGLHSRRAHGCCMHLP